MSRTEMHRLSAANPVAQLPAPRPIDAVLPGWAELDGPGADRRAFADLPDRASQSRTRSLSASRILSVIPAAIGVLVAVAVAILALVAVHAANRPTSTASPPTSERTYTDAQGWSLTYPSSFRLIKQTPAGQFELKHVTLTSFSAPRKLVPGNTQTNLFRQPYTLPLDATGRFPADGVALILQPSSASVLGPDSAFPVALSEFGRPHIERFFSSADSRRAAIPPARTREIVAYSQEITAVALIGAKASPTLRTELTKVIASLSFPRLSPGEQVGIGEVLGPASRYPVGSFTFVHVRSANNHSEPTYLVHAPGRLGYGHQCQTYSPCIPAGAFYGIGSVYNTRNTRAPRCQLRLDRQHDEFYCSNLGVRWDRIGRVISRPANESYIGSIEGLYAKIAWDGQIMIIPGFGPQQSRAAVQKLWPNWQQPNEPLSR